MPTIPLSLSREPDEPDAVQISVEARIADEPVRALLDTGGGSSSFAGKQIEGLDIIDSNTGVGITGTVAPDDIVIIPRLSLGALVVHDLPASRLPTNGVRPSHIGMDVLGQHRCHFRFKSEVLEIDEAIPPDLQSFPLAVLPFGQPVLPVRFGNQQATALWDSGAALTGIDESFADANPHLVKITGQSEGIDSAGVRFTAATAVMAGCTIGDVALESTPCFIHDFRVINDDFDTRVDLVIGAPLMMTADWLFDFPAETWALVPDR